ncbi:MAG TPA: glycosyltransferase family 2 protein [Cyclobacteriaceae bacterium]
MHSLKIHLYTFCYNEERIIPYFLSHYLSFVEKIIVLDNHSSDASVALFQKHRNIFIKRYNSNNQYREDIKQNLSNSIWKKSRGYADFVIVCDIDEILYHPRLSVILSTMKNKGYTVLKPYGFDMISNNFPTTKKNIYDEIKEGKRDRMFDKIALFNPDAIKETNYYPGAHAAIPEGKVKIYKNDPELKLLHYRYLGIDYILDKHKSRAERMSTINRQNNWGYQYLYGEEKQRLIFQKVFNERTKVL